MDAERIELAQRFLQEAVYRSRAKQAAESAVQSGNPALGNCGLGAKPALALDLSERGRELFEALRPTSLDDAELDRVRDVMREWIRAQDAFDRQRNHYLKAFRREHGFDRRAYTPEQTAAYDAGLAAVAAESNAALRSAAERLLAAL